MKILITGGAGYIASHTINELIKSSIINPEDINPENIIVIDNLESGHEENVKYGNLIIADIKDKKKIESILSKYKPEVVMHFAANISAPESIKEPLKYYYNNVVGSINIIDAAVKNNAKYIIFSSSAAIYGNPVELPIKETHPLQPLNPYGWTKYMAERIIIDSSKAYGFKYAILRYFNVVGCDLSLNLKISKTLEDNVFLRLFKTITGKQDKFIIFGDDYETRDGTCIRDYIHVVDLAKAHISVLKYLFNGGNSEIFNVGYGEGLSVKQLVDAAQRSIKKFRYEIGKRRVGDPSISIADNSKILSLTEWKPEHNNIKEMLNSYWNWISGE